MCSSMLSWQECSTALSPSLPESITDITSGASPFLLQSITDISGPSPSLPESITDITSGVSPSLPDAASRDGYSMLCFVYFTDILLTILRVSGSR